MLSLQNKWAAIFETATPIFKPPSVLLRLIDRPSLPIPKPYRIDGFWHTLSHEISHIRHGDSLSVDSDIFGEETAQCSIEEIEKRAEREAAEFLIPKAMLDSFILRVRPLYSKVRII